MYCRIPMKTTIEIADSLLEAAKAVAAEEGTTVRALVESGLRHKVAEHRAQYGAFKLPDESFDGEGIAPDLRGASWERIRDLAYGHDA
jgi:Bacterial antitoxin of type II TA system, VapB